MTDRAKIVEVLKDEKRFNLISHMLPDGDSIGSLLAMGEALKLAGKEVEMYTPDYIPRRYKFLSGAEDVSHEVPADSADITAVVLDSSDPERLGALKNAIMNSRQIINIDHHITNHNFGTLNLVDPGAAATGEIVYHILKDTGITINKSVAEALYVAIATDTGSFKFDNTMPGTHRVVASLLDHTLNPGTLSQKIFDEHPLSFYILLKEALSSLELDLRYGIALMTLSRDIRERSGAKRDDLEGIVNYTRNIEGIELGILFYVEGKNEVKVGFRSKNLDVSILAGKLNGGGHARAAGCRLYGNYQSVKEKVLREAYAMLRRQ